MEKEKSEIHLFKEKEKIRQVTHWDLDYLSKDEILDLYNRKTVYHQQKEEIGHAIGKNTPKFLLLLITVGLLLLAGSLCISAWI
jgi:hypothetical protein